MAHRCRVGPLFPEVRQWDTSDIDRDDDYDPVADDKEQTYIHRPFDVENTLIKANNRGLRASNGCRINDDISVEILSVQVSVFADC